MLFFYSQKIVTIDKLPQFWSLQKASHIRVNIDLSRDLTGADFGSLSIKAIQEELTSSFKYWSAFVMRMSYSICSEVIKNQYSINIKLTRVSIWFWTDWRNINWLKSQFSHKFSMYETSSLALNVVEVYLSARLGTDHSVWQRGGRIWRKKYKGKRRMRNVWLSVRFELSAYRLAHLRANRWTQREFVHTRRAGKYMHANEKRKEAEGKKGKRRKTQILAITCLFAPMKA